MLQFSQRFSVGEKPGPTLEKFWKKHQLNKDQPSLTNPHDMLHHGERAANK